MGRYSYDKNTKQLSLLSGCRVTTIETDSALSTTSTNPVQNKVISEALDDLQVQFTTIPTASATYEGRVIQYVGETNQNYTNGCFYRCEEDNGSYSWTLALSGDNGSGGHIIENSSGTEMTQRKNLKFVNANVTDSSQSDTTVVSAIDNGHVIQNSSGSNMTQRTNLKFLNADVTDDSTNDTTIISIKDIQVTTIPTASASRLGDVVQYIGSTGNGYFQGYFYQCTSYEDTQTGDIVYEWTNIEVQDHLTHRLIDLNDVNIQSSNLQDNDIIVWNSATSKWVIGKLPPEIQYDVLPTPSASYLDKIVQFTGTSPYTNGYFYKCVYDEDHYEWVEWKVMRIPGDTPMLVDVYGASISREFTTATITWSDPADSQINTQTVAAWGGTKLIRKEGSAPQNEEDGVLIVNNTTRNQYSSSGYEDDTLEYGKVYYYRLFPYTTTNVYTKGTALYTNCQRIVVPVPTQSVPLYFNNKTQAPTLSSNVGVSLSQQTEGKYAGNYQMTVSLVSDDYIWSDGTSSDKTLIWTINKAPGSITPSPSKLYIGGHVTHNDSYFPDLYDREIITVSSSNTSIATVSTDGQTVVVNLASNNANGTATITVTTDATENCYSATSTITVEATAIYVYGFYIDDNESDPSAKVTYLEDAIGMTPAYMDYENDVFNYGSWQNAFFMPRPCMVRDDGTVDYYLNPNDYTKKADGTTSDVANASYPGNAMMEWGKNGDKIWYYIEPQLDNTSAKVYISNRQITPSYHDWSFHNYQGDSVDHFYTAIYDGTIINSKLRSISNRYIGSTTSFLNYISYAKANNPDVETDLWNISTLADKILINFLLVLMSKSTDTQTSFGFGYTNGNPVNSISSGTLDQKGLFYGSSSSSQCVKVFGMENWWGFTHNYLVGLLYSNRRYRFKLTNGKEDGTDVVGYNNDGTGYIISDFYIDGNYGTPIRRMAFTDSVMLPFRTAGSSSTNYCDQNWDNTSGTHIASSGGSYENGSGCGAFCLAVDQYNNPNKSHFSANLSMRPLT